ncbi:hypothetical protein P5W98_00965 [Paraburkholderia sp. A1BS-2L]|uniref:hypothetical protein n=1 Tax=Paraburkholderia sp. A1BS-2L TaxID=3028373 RepID=UPI003DA925B6
MDKNIDCYRRYIDPHSLLSANPGSTGSSSRFAKARQRRRQAGHPRGLDFGPFFAALRLRRPGTILMKPGFDDERVWYDEKFPKKCGIHASVLRLAGASDIDRTRRPDGRLG